MTKLEMTSDMMETTVLEHNGEDWPTKKWRWSLKVINLIFFIVINQSINALYSGIFHPYTNYVITQLCDKKKAKQTSMHVHIAYASNAGAMEAYNNVISDVQSVILTGRPS